MSSSASAPDVTVVVVLYGTTPSTSLALTSLAESLGPQADRFAVEVHDNSPTPGEDRSVAGLTVAADVHHPDNPGLVVPYNLALAAAERRGSRWLMLLDQDTRVTREYIDEVVAFVEDETVPLRIAVAAPRLHDAEGVLSPHKPIRFEVRPLDVGRTYPPGSSYAYLNSGAVMRVTAARAVGGFPVEYPLDFLDHAMSARLKAAGYNLRTLSSALEHQLAARDIESVPRVRLESIFRAEEQYFATTPRSEALWMIARRGARGVLLVLRAHTSVHRHLELEAIRRGLHSLTARRGRPTGGPTRSFDGSGQHRSTRGDA